MGVDARQRPGKVPGSPPAQVSGRGYSVSRLDLGFQVQGVDCRVDG